MKLHYILLLVLAGCKTTSIQIDPFAEYSEKPLGCGECVDVRALDEPFQVLRRTAPEIPSELRKFEQFHGFVEVEFIVGGDGRVENVAILYSTNELIARSVRDSIYQWKFSKLRVNGEPAKAKSRTVIPFLLGGEPPEGFKKLLNEKFDEYGI